MVWGNYIMFIIMITLNIVLSIIVALDIYNFHIVFCGH